MKSNGAASVVIADDHPIVLSGLQGLLGSCREFNVLRTCSNGADALQCIKELAPDLGVLDITMPGATGLQVLESLEFEGLGTRIVLLTASATDDQIATAVARGAWGIMLKDSAADALIDCLKGVVAGERYFPPELVSPALARNAERRLATDRIEDLLTAREREIALFVAQGLSNKQIARKVNISEGTVKIHLHNTYQKLGIANRTGLATLAQRFWVDINP